MNLRKVFGTVIHLCAILSLATSFAVARGQDDPAAYRLITSDAEEPAPSMAESPSYSSACAGCCDQGCCRSDCDPRWTATADYLILDRIGTKSQTLLQNIRTREELNSNDFQFGFYSGPRVSLIRHGDRCYDLEFLYFGIDGWSSSRSVDAGTYITYVSGEPNLIAGPLRTDYASRLYNGEINLRWSPLCRVTVLAGFRWAELRENLTGYERVLDTTDTWDLNGAIKTDNNLYGFQIGADTKLWEYGCLSIDGLLKVGIYDNHAQQTSISYQRGTTIYDSTDHTAFIGEVGLQALYQITPCLAFRAGYQAFWFDGVAVPPAQINDGYGINTAASVFYHGANAGLEYKF